MPSYVNFIVWIRDICDNDTYVYSQDYRNQESDGKGHICFDCSSFVNYAIVAAGFSTPNHAPNHNAFVTSNMYDILISLGWYPVSAKGNINRGDIGINIGEHTEICYTAGKNGKAVFAGAHKAKGVAYANQVSIGSTDGDRTYTRSFSNILRYDWADNPQEQPTPNPSKFSFYIAAAIAGNWKQESVGINPGVWESLIVKDWTDTYSNNTGGYGLGQWTNTDGNKHGRLYQLHEWLVSSGYAVDDGDGQIAYIPIENHWNNTALENHGYGGIFTSLEDFLYNTDYTDLDTLTAIFSIGWEGHTNSDDIKTRQGYAKTLYDYIVEHYADTGKTWISDNRRLSDTECENNVICMYQAFNGIVDDGTYIYKDNSSDLGESYTETALEIVDYKQLFAASLGKNNSNNQIHIKERRK